MAFSRLAGMSEPAETFVQTLIAYCRTERKRQRLSQQEVAKRMATNKAVVSKLEAGRHDPTLHTLLKYILAIPGVMEQLMGILKEMAEPVDGSLLPSIGQCSQINWPRHTPSFIVNATKQMRKARRMTLEEMGERLGVSKTLLGNIEGGREAPIDVLLGRLYAVDYRQGDQFIGALNEIAAGLRADAIQRQLESG